MNPYNSEPIPSMMKQVNPKFNWRLWISKSAALGKELTGKQPVWGNVNDLPVLGEHIYS